MALKKSWPVLVILLISLTFVGWRLAGANWQARELAEVGSQFSQGESEGTEGYDGQFVLFMAEQLDPDSVAEKLDVPAYRYQRILLPVLARAAAFGQISWVPWSLIGVNILAHLAGTWAVSRILDHHGRWVGFSLLYGLWTGLLVGVGADLHEPLAYGLVAVAWWLRMQDRHRAAIGLVGLALLAKETTFPFLAAFMLADIFQRQWPKNWPAYLSVLAAYTLWQGWLWSVFGQPGLGSGGQGATSFELIPFMGFIRIAFVSLRVFGIFLLLFGPGILLPSLWAAFTSLSELINDRRRLSSWALLLNAGVIMVLPFSTFREPLGLLRLATGLVFALIVFSAARGLRRPLVYGWFWIAYLPLIL